MSALGQKQTCAAQKPMSAKCQKRTLPVGDTVIGAFVPSVYVKRGGGFAFSVDAEFLVIASSKATSQRGH
jgi:hypothetical protein